MVKAASTHRPGRWWIPRFFKENIHLFIIFHYFYYFIIFISFDENGKQWSQTFWTLYLMFTQIGAEIFMCIQMTVYSTLKPLVFQWRKKWIEVSSLTWPNSENRTWPKKWVGGRHKKIKWSGIFKINLQIFISNSISFSFLSNFKRKEIVLGSV